VPYHKFLKRLDAQGEPLAPVNTKAPVPKKNNNKDKNNNNKKGVCHDYIEQRRSTKKRGDAR